MADFALARWLRFLEWMVGRMAFFGDPATFAVEYVPIDPIDQPFARCRFTYWIGGSAIGNPEFEATTCDVANDVWNLLVDRNHRRDDALFVLNGADLVQRLNAGLMGLDADLEAIANEDRWAAHNLGYDMRHGYLPEHGRSWRIYLVESEAEGRLVYLDEAAPDAILEQRLPSGAADAALLAAWELLKDA